MTTEPFYQQGRITLYAGDCLAVLRALPDASIDALVTDPPYGLTSGELRVGFRYCLRYIALQVLLPQFNHTNAKRGQQVQFTPVLGQTAHLHRVDRGGVDAGIGVPVGAIDFQHGIEGREVEIAVTGETPGGIAESILPEVNDAAPIQLSGDFILQLRDDIGLAFCEGACGCYRQLRAGCVTLPVVIAGVPDSSGLDATCLPGDPRGLTDSIGPRDYSARNSYPTPGIVAGTGTELPAVLTLNAADRTFELTSASRADEARFILTPLRAQTVGTGPATGGLPPPSESTGIGPVDGMAHGTLTLDHAVYSFFKSIIPDKGFMGKEWDGTSIAFSEDFWRECLRVLKPGAYLIAFGGTRTYHHLASAIENAGFEVRDMLAWLHGQGFPKSLDISKEFDRLAGTERKVIGQTRAGKNALGQGSGWNAHNNRTEIDVTAPTSDLAQQWAGWGTALKPAMEPLVMARAPLSESSIARNVARWGTGALNIDASRVELGGTEHHTTAGAQQGNGTGLNPRFTRANQQNRAVNGDNPRYDPAGRWPPHLLLSHADGCRPIGTRRVRGSAPIGPNGHSNKASLFQAGGGDNHRQYTDADGYETVDAWACVPGCPVTELDAQSGKCESRPGKTKRNGQGVTFVGGWQPQLDGARYPADTGGASRFYPTFTPFRYVPKPDQAERNQGCEVLPNKTAGEATGRIDGSAGLQSPRAGAGRTNGARNHHPTVKSQSLMQWLIRLVTPPGGIVLDCFGGSGSTIIAADQLGFGAIYIDNDPDYPAIARARLIGDAPLFAWEQPA